MMALSNLGVETFEELVAKYHQKIFNLIYRYVGDYYEAEDLTQDTFLHAYQAFPKFRGQSTAYTWLYRIAINLSMNRLKQLQRKRRAELGSLDQPIPGAEEDSAPREVEDLEFAPERVAESRELQQVLQQCIARLPEEYRVVIILRDMQGFSYQEIAEVTSLSLEAVKSRLFRARMQLKKMLEPYMKHAV